MSGLGGWTEVQASADAEASSRLAGRVATPRGLNNLGVRAHPVRRTRSTIDPSTGANRHAGGFMMPADVRWLRVRLVGLVASSSSPIRSHTRWRSRASTRRAIVHGRNRARRLATVVVVSRALSRRRHSCLDPGPERHRRSTAPTSSASSADLDGAAGKHASAPRARHAGGRGRQAVGRLPGDGDDDAPGDAVWARRERNGAVRALSGAPPSTWAASSDLRRRPRRRRPRDGIGVTSSGTLALAQL